MLTFSTDFARAEIRYRQELLRREYQRPWLVRRWRRTETRPVPRPQVVRARPAV